MTDAERERFDALLQDVIDGLPPKIHALMDEVPLVVLDRPTDEMIKDLVRDGVIEEGCDPTELCGLHSGVAITERSIEDPGGWGAWGHDSSGPEEIHIFREGIVSIAGGWGEEFADENIYEEIRITILHEIGHHFGLDEDDLDELGYG